MNVRFQVGFLIALGSFTMWMIRSNISITIIAMVEGDGNQPNYGERFNWSKSDVSWILGGGYYGSLLSTFFGGFLAEKLGGRKAVGSALIGCSIFSALSPSLATDTIWFMFLNQVIIGVFLGLIFPGLQTIISKWSPKEERGKFVAVMMSGTLGTTYTWAVLGISIENFGWKFGFYMPSALSMFFAILWFWIVYDTPSDHPSISLEERTYIENSLGESTSKEKLIAPFNKIFTSVPFLALLLAHFGSVWGLYFFLNAIPLFMFEVLQFELSKTGFLSVLPSIMRIIMGFIFGAVGDTITRHKLMKVVTIRKSFCLCSHIIPGLLLITIPYLAFNSYLIVTVITLSLGINGSAVLTNVQNSFDLSPNFAGTLSGIMHAIATTSGFISPRIVSYYTKDESTLATWQYIFWIGAAVYILPALVFIIFGKGEIQEWNDVKRSEDLPFKKSLLDITIHTQVSKIADLELTGVFSRSLTSLH